MSRIPRGVRKEIRSRAKEFAGSLKSFSESAAVFSSGSPPLIDKYDGTWVGVYQGRVAASGKTLDSVTRSLKSKGIPLSETMIRRIDREEKTLIL